MTDQIQNQQKNAEIGEEIVRKQKAQGEPGTKQPSHEDLRASAEETVSKIEEMIEASGAAEPRKSSAERTHSDGEGNHPVAPEERTGNPMGNYDQQLQEAAAHLDSARTAVTRQVLADTALLSDPRYERDQEIFDLGRTGQLGKVAPSEAEKVKMVGGDAEEVADAIPDSTEEQAEEDMKRLEDAKKDGDKDKGNAGTKIS